MKSEDKKALKKIFLTIISVLIIYSIMLIPPVRKVFFSKEIHSYSNNDGSYRIALYAIDNPFFVLGAPGSSSADRVGFVRLYNKENELLQEEDIPMVQLVNEGSIFWTDDEVHVKFVAFWPLPKSESK